MAKTATVQDGDVFTPRGAPGMTVTVEAAVDDGNKGLVRLRTSRDSVCWTTQQRLTSAEFYTRAKSLKAAA